MSPRLLGFCVPLRSCGASTPPNTSTRGSGTNDLIPGCLRRTRCRASVREAHANSGRASGEGGPGNRLKRQRGKGAKRRKAAKRQRHKDTSASGTAAAAKRQSVKSHIAVPVPLPLDDLKLLGLRIAPLLWRHPSCRHGREGRASVMRQSVGLQYPHTAALRAWQPAGSRRPLSQAPGPGEVRSNRMDTATMRVDGTRRDGHAFRGQTGRMAGAFGRRRTTWVVANARRPTCGATRRPVGRGGSNCAYLSRQVL